jgi:hypothetical protein
MSAPHPDRLATGKIVAIRNGERRQVQFLIERNWNGFVHPSFPLPVWVYYPAEPRIDYGCEKCEGAPSSMVYRIVEDKIDLAYKLAGIPRPKNVVSPFVCEHMGHLIE